MTPTYHWVFDEDSNKWLVLNQDRHLVAGPFAEVEAAKDWIESQREYQERIDS